jgi:hypothetical protein
MIFHFNTGLTIKDKAFRMVTEQIVKSLIISIVISMNYPHRYFSNNMIIDG